MNLLLDTHVFIWWAEEPERLSANAMLALQDTSNRLFLSLVSVWEIQIKTQLGKMQLSLPLKDLVDSQLSTNGLEILPITREHIFAVDTLPFHHKDPFDRLIIAQSMIENATIVSLDPKLSEYSVNVLW